MGYATFKYLRCRFLRISSCPKTLNKDPQNKGAMMGCSNPHPHGQVWSMSDIPTIPGKELASLQRYALSDVERSNAPRGPQDRPCLLCEYAHHEVTGSHGERIVARNNHWVALVPWWATWPFEILSQFMHSLKKYSYFTSGLQQCCRIDDIYRHSRTSLRKNRLI